MGYQAEELDPPAGPAGPPADGEQPEQASLSGCEGDAGSEAESRAVHYSEEELQELLADRCRWTIFEDAEDEIRYLRRRSDVLASGLRASRAETARLQEAGVALQEAYEALQQEYREAVGDNAYWQTLAEARAEELAAAQAAAEAAAAGPEPAAAAAGQALAAQGAGPATAGQEEQLAEGRAGAAGLPRALERRPSPREALRAAAAEATHEAALAEARRWRRIAEQRGEELALLRRSSGLVATASDASQAQMPGASTGSPAALACRGHEPPDGCAEPMLGTPSERSASLATPQISPSHLDCSSSMSFASTAARKGARGSAARVRPRALFSQAPPAGARKFGIGSAPRRCPGLGTPTRRAPESRGQDGGDGAPPRYPPHGGRRGRSPVEAAPRIAALVDLWEGKRREPSPDAMEPHPSARGCGSAEAAGPAAKPLGRTALLVATPARPTSLQAATAAAANEGTETAAAKTEHARALVAVLPDSELADASAGRDAVRLPRRALR
mmetsp:Transcript_33552/g.106435  ORF Transcript_33552/g.106435 Transcript_33552/m.106435 type:complete len:502 (-) Transcript_33552:196-1701(-)